MFVKQEITSEQLREAYVSGQRVFEGVEIIGNSEYPSISDMDLHEARFVNCWFHSTKFRHVNLCGVTFLASNLKCITFQN